MSSEHKCGKKGKYWCYFCRQLVECTCGWRTTKNHEHTVEEDAGEAE